MTPLLAKGLEAITSRINLATGLARENDMNVARAMFFLLREAGEELVGSDVLSWAVGRGWKWSDAEELGSIAQRINEGKEPRIRHGGGWKEGIIDQFRNELKKE